VQSLPENCRDEIFLGIWTIKDLLAHLVGWDFTNLKAVQEILAGQYPSFFQYYDKDWQSYNHQLVEKYRKESLAEVVAEVEDSHRQLVLFLQSLSAEEVVRGKVRRVNGRSVTIRNLLISEAGDESKHVEQVIAFYEQRIARPD
jgi:hypothetical protein